MPYPIAPSIRFRDLPAAYAFYQKLGFATKRGTVEEGNISVYFGEASMMLESQMDFYSAEYNAAIAKRLGTPSANALYIEAEDIDELYATVNAAGIAVIDPLGPRDWGQTEFTIEDPEGNFLTFWAALQ